MEGVNLCLTHANLEKKQNIKSKIEMEETNKTDAKKRKHEKPVLSMAVTAKATTTEQNKQV